MKYPNKPQKIFKNAEEVKSCWHVSILFEDSVERLKVPQGWIVKYEKNITWFAFVFHFNFKIDRSVLFITDPNHEWELEDEE